jgi:hypothetical protein
MSVGDSFTLLPLSKYFVRKSITAGTETNLPAILPVSSGNVTASNVTGGTFTYYRLFRFEGTPNNQGVELKTYVLVVRGFITSTGTGNADLIPLPEAFDNNIKIYKLFYDTISTAQGNYTASVNSTSTGIIVNFGVIGPDALTPIVNDGFMFLVWGF